MVEDNYEQLEQLERVWDQKYQQKYGYWRPCVTDVIYKFLDCGDPHFGFARVKRDDCKLIDIYMASVYTVYIRMQKKQPALLFRLSYFQKGGGRLVMNIIISNSSPEPIYQQIVTQIKDLILKGDLTEAEGLPSIRILAKELQISVITTKRAYEELERDGYIETVGGKGSFVSAQNKELLYEKRLRVVEEKVFEAIVAARTAGLERKDFLAMCKLLWEEQ